MVHLQYTPIALRTVVATVWFCLVAPLTDSHTSKLLFLHRHLQADIGELPWTKAGLVRSATRTLNERTLSRLKILVIFMHDFFWVFHVPFNHAVWKFRIKWVWLLVLLAMAEALIFTATVDLTRVCTHIPFFMVRNITWIGSDCSYNGNQEVEREKRKEASTPQRFVPSSFDNWFITFPNFVKGDLWIVSGDSRVKEKLCKR